MRKCITQTCEVSLLGDSGPHGHLGGSSFSAPQGEGVDLIFLWASGIMVRDKDWGCRTCREGQCGEPAHFPLSSAP